MTDTRFVGWAVLFLLCLGMLSIRVEYCDGYKIELIGWPEKLFS